MYQRVVVFYPIPANLFLHHLVDKGGAVLHRNAHGVDACGQLANVERLQAAALRMHQAALHVVELDLRGLRIRRVLHSELALRGVGIEAVGTHLHAALVGAYRAVVINEQPEQTTDVVLFPLTMACNGHALCAIFFKGG